MNKLDNFKIQISIIVIVQAMIIGAIYFIGWKQFVIPLAVMLLINILIIIWTMVTFQKEKEKHDIDISRILGRDAKDALLFGKVGIITYDEQYNVTWVNDFMEERELNLVGKKLSSWIEKISELFQGEVDVILGEDRGVIYEITRKENAQVLYVRDVTAYESLKERYRNEYIVAGLLHLDNYMEIQQYEDEVKMSQINGTLSQIVLDWAKKYGMFVRRLRADRYVVILNESIFAEVSKDKFSLLNEVRSAADAIDVSITLSMSFARGTNDLHLLDVMVNDLLELALSRGGDQVAIKRYGESVKYFGGNGEAQEKRSKVRVRVMSQAIKEAVQEADQVFIVGHKTMDFDCMGSALGVSRLCQAHGKTCYIVSESGGIEEQLSNALQLYHEKLSARHRFISDSEACRIRKSNALVIAVDHHDPTQCGAPQILEAVKKVVVIDHHRRGENFISNPLLVYVESGASSVSELVTEFFPYQSRKVDISVEEATMMYLGILVDTNRFKMRTGSRTFEAAAALKKLDVDPITAEDLLKEDFDEFEAKITIQKYSQKYFDNMIIAAVDEENIMTRTLMSQSADRLLNIKDVEASFVIARVSEKAVAISARSKGKVNVQRIMEMMHGGGHFSAAALQSETKSVEMLKEELIQTIETLKQEDTKNESNTIE